jgi:outer membrane biogenesis lipoprotein LolB
MKKQLLALKHAPKKAIFLLSVFLLLAACTFSVPEVNNASPAKDTKGCLASQNQISLRDCLTAVYNARLVDAYTLGQLR